MAAKFPTDAKGRRDLAVDFCEGRIRHYARYKVLALLSFYFFQTGIIVLSAVTPLLILEDIGSALFRAAPAAIAGVFAALSTVYHTRENWVRCVEIEDALSQELLKYQTESTALYNSSVPDGRALSNFVLSVERILEHDTSRWRAMFDEQMATGRSTGNGAQQGSALAVAGPDAEPPETKP